MEIKVLIDSGSTNSFIDPRILEKLKIKLSKTYTLIVMVANEDRTISKDEVTALKDDARTFIYSRH